jgi:glycosyltransferase involved in cell wall biosynthesis
VNSSEAVVLLTAAFPFGNKSETFLETEIEILAERFKRIFILPSHREGGVRPLPPNVILVEMDWLDAPSRWAKLGALHSVAAGRVALATFRTPANWRPYLRAARMYADLLAHNVLKLRSLARFIRDHRLEGAIFYDYWFENSTLALALLRRSGAISAAVCRAHRFDVYDECWGQLPVPFREFKARGLDVIFAVSEFGARYLRQRIPALDGKIRVSRLGVREQPWTGTERGAAPLVVSCGSLLPHKRVQRIPDMLVRLGRPLRWVHLGEGPERPAVQDAASRLPAHVAWELPGHLDNRDLLRFYRRNEVDALLSLSVSEGLPVSMMEAQSFGIPVVAVGVHGVPEIVNETTGVLLPPDAGPEQAAVGLAAALEPGRFDRARIREFFREHYEANANYNLFADSLISLREDQATSA